MCPTHNTKVGGEIISRLGRGACDGGGNESEGSDMQNMRGKCDKMDYSIKNHTNVQMQENTGPRMVQTLPQNNPPPQCPSVGMPGRDCSHGHQGNGMLSSRCLCGGGRDRLGIPGAP